MNKKVLLFVFICVFIRVLCGQDVFQFSDSLGIYANTIPDRALDSIAFYRLSEDYDSYPDTIKTTLDFQETYIQLRKGKFDTVKKLGREYMRKHEQWGELSTQSNLANYLGVAYAQTGQVDSAVFYWAKGADQATASKPSIDRAVTYANMGMLLNLDRQHERSLEWLRKSYVILKTYEGREPVDRYAKLLINVAGTMSNAFQLADQLDSAYHYATEAIAINNNEYNIGGYFTALGTLAALAAKEGDTTKTLELYKKQYILADSLGDSKHKHYAGIQMGVHLKDEALATKYIEEGYKYYKANDKTMDGNAAKRLITQYENTGQYEKAYTLLSEVTAEKDSTGQQLLREKQEELVVKFETAEKEKLIAVQETQLVQKQLLQNRLVAGMILLALLTGAFFLYYLQNKKIEKQKAFAERQENEKRFAQLETMILKSQMNPHFLFNSLNSIRYLFMKDQKEQGLVYITKFAKLLRTSLQLGEAALVPLGEEMQLTELYISLEQLRFDDQFSYTANQPAGDDWKSVPMPPFVVQPIVENAFWHGLSQSDNDLKKLQIDIAKSNDTWLIKIEDNGIGLANSKASVDVAVGKKKSYGLSLIQERFDLINKTGDQKYSLEVRDSMQHPTGAAITISITPKPQ